MSDHDFWTVSLVIRTVSWALRRKSGLRLMSEQLEEIEKRDQNGSMWGQEEQFEGQWRRRSDRAPVWLFVWLSGACLFVSLSSIACTYVYVCSWLLWVATLTAGTSALECETCSLTKHSKWRSVMSRLCSDVGSWLLNSEPRDTNCELSCAKEIWLGLEVRTARRDWKRAPKRLHVRSKWAVWGPVKASLRPRSTFLWSKSPSRWILSLPSKHFGIVCGPIFRDFGD